MSWDKNQVAMTVQVPMKTYVCKMMKKILDNTTTRGAVHEIVDSKDSKKS